MSTKRLAIFISLLLIAVWSLGASYFKYRVDIELINYSERQIADLNVAWQAVQKLQQRGKEAYFQTYINQPETLEILRQAQNPDYRDIARDTLYERMIHPYDYIKSQGVHQFQFVLPNNESLLRVHYPERYGDNLEQLRVSFRLANETLKPIHGFELGRVLPGFRSIYPVIDEKGQHLGSVEFSNRFETLRHDIALLDNSREYALILHPRVKLEVFDTFKEAYAPSPFHSAWLEEINHPSRPNDNAQLSTYGQRIGKIINQRPDLNEKMLNGENFALSFTYDHRTHIATFLAIHDIENQNAAFLVAFAPAPLLDGLKSDFNNNIAVSTVLIILLGWTLFSVLRNREELRVAATAFNVQEGITITDPNGKILKVNKAFTRLTGYQPHEVIGLTPAVLSSGRQDKQFYQIMWQSLKKNGSWQGEIWNRRKSGEVYAEWLTITAVYNEKGRITHYVGAFLDITQRKEDEEQIRKLAFYDPLTELPNRRLLMDRLEHAMATSARTRRYCAVLFLDLDNFKTLNDTKGHDVGDLLLLEVAKRLKLETRESDTVARLGGDEFVVLYEGLNQNEEKASLEVEYLAERIRESLNQPYVFKDYQHFSSPSIGIALFCGHTTRIDELLKNADNAMYQAKNAGRNTIRLFDPQMQLALEKRLKLEDDLRQSIERNELEIYFQPQIHGNRIIGAEALIRWHHPQDGLISPAQFIPIAEETGFILQIGDWVIQQACLRLSEWLLDPAMSHLTLSANISVRQLREVDFVEKIRYWLSHYKTQPGQLKLEITESMLLDELNDTIQKMQALKKRGVLFAMDDFGTGYSSLSNIKRLPLDQIKIDQSFVQDIDKDENSLVLTQTIVAMANSLGIGLLAEGVETATQQALLQQMGCFDYQGYYFHKPMPYDQFKNLLKKLK